MKITKEEKDKLLQIIDTLQKENAQLKKQNELLQYEVKGKYEEAWKQLGLERPIKRG